MSDPNHYQRREHSGGPWEPNGYQQDPYASQPSQQFPPPPPNNYNPADYANDPHPTGTTHFHQHSQQQGIPDQSSIPNQDNELAPYDPEKAYANYYEAYPPRQRYSAPPPPLSSGYDEPYYTQAQSTDNRRHRHERHHLDRYKSEDEEEAGRRKDGKDRPKFGVKLSEQEKGLGASVLGGAGGALVGHEFAGGSLGTLGGIVLGAIGANMLGERHEKHKKERKARRKYDDDERRNGSHYGPSSTDSYPPAVPPPRKSRRSRSLGTSNCDKSEDNEYNEWRRPADTRH